MERWRKERRWDVKKSGRIDQPENERIKDVVEDSILFESMSAFCSKKNEKKVKSELQCCNWL